MRRRTESYTDRPPRNHLVEYRCTIEEVISNFTAVVEGPPKAEMLSMGSFGRLRLYTQYADGGPVIFSEDICYHIRFFLLNRTRHCKTWIEILDKYLEVWEERLGGLDPSDQAIPSPQSSVRFPPKTKHFVVSALSSETAD